MTTITPGTGATITSTTIESFFCGAIWLLQNLESDVARNPSGINNVTSTISDDSRSISGSANFLTTVESDTNGKALFTTTDYLTTPANASAHWIPGTGGTIKSATIQGAIFEAVRFINNLESQVAKNPEGKKTVSWSLQSSNDSEVSTVNIALAITFTNFPLTYSFNAAGTQTLTGKAYLL